MADFHDSENARARDEALRSARPTRGSRTSELWAALTRYLSGELEHERRTEEQEKRADKKEKRDGDR